METLTEPTTKEQVIRIRELYRDGATREEVAKYLKLDKSFVHCIINEKHYKRDSWLPDPLVPRHEIAFHPESTLQGYHQLTNTIWSFAKNNRYGRIVAVRDNSVSVRIDGKRTSRKKDVFVQECLTQVLVGKPGIVEIVPASAEAIKKLQDGQMSAVETQVILGSRGIRISIQDIEFVRDSSNSTQYDPAISDVKIIDECMEILLPLWEKHKIHNKRAPDCEFWQYIHQARDRYRRFRDQIDMTKLSGLALMGHEALEYFIDTNTTDQRLTVFWKPLFAKWYHTKYPNRNRNIDD